MQSNVRNYSILHKRSCFSKRWLFLLNSFILTFWSNISCSYSFIGVHAKSWKISVIKEYLMNDGWHKGKILSESTQIVIPVYCIIVFSREIFSVIQPIRIEVFLFITWNLKYFCFYSGMIQFMHERDLDDILLSLCHSWHSLVFPCFLYTSLICDAWSIFDFGCLY